MVLVKDFNLSLGYCIVLFLVFSPGGAFLCERGPLWCQGWQEDVCWFSCGFEPCSRQTDDFRFFIFTGKWHCWKYRLKWSGRTTGQGVPRRMAEVPKAGIPCVWLMWLSALMTNFRSVVLIFAGDFFYYHWFFFHNMLFSNNIYQWYLDTDA